MRRTLGNVISVAHSAIRFGILKLMPGANLKVGMIQRFSPNVVFELDNGGTASIGDRIRAHSGCKFKVRKGAMLELGDNVSFNYNCIVVCHKAITIGEGTEFGPSVYLYDHDHDYKVGLKKAKFLDGSIVVGRNCWIGANTVILRGTVIGDNCVIGAGSIVKGVVPDNSVLIQQRNQQIRSYG